MNNRQWVDRADIQRAVEKLKRRGEDVLDAAKRAMKEGADEIVADAKSRVPVKTGRLRDSIHAEEKENGAVQEIHADARNEKMTVDITDIHSGFYLTVDVSMAIVNQRLWGSESRPHI